MNLNLVELLDNRIAGKDESHRLKHFHVTSLSMCARGVIIARKNPQFVEHDARTKRIFSCGHLFEEFVLSALPKERVIATQEQVAWPEFGLIGSCDVIVKDDAGNPLLLELKSQNSRAFHWNKKRGGAQEHHIQQVNLYYSKLKEKYPNLTMGIAYVSKDDLCLDTYTVQEDTKLVTKALETAKTLKTHWDAGTLPEVENPVVWDDLAEAWVINWKAKYCPVHHFCMEDDMWLSKAEALVEIKNKK